MGKPSILHLTWKDNQYKVNLPGDQSGEYVMLEDYERIEAQRDQLLEALEQIAERGLGAKSNTPA